MCYMSSNKVNFAFQMTQEYLMILLSIHDVDSITCSTFLKKRFKVADSSLKRTQWIRKTTREKRFFDQLCKDGKLKVGGVAVFREKGRNPHPFSHCCFRSLFFSGTFSLFFIEKKLLPLVYGFGLILKSVFSSISSPAPPSTGFFLLFPSLSFFFFWYQKLLVLIPKVFPYKK